MLVLFLEGLQVIAFCSLQDGVNDVQSRKERMNLSQFDGLCHASSLTRPRIKPSNQGKSR